jgi:hypothetical protein
MKPMPASRMHWLILSGAMSILMPSACSTSEAPDFELSARLPCLATGMPAAAATIEVAVEMLSVSAPSPPVPTISTTLSGASTVTGTILARRIETAAAISPTVSPFTRMPIRNAPIWLGVASPSMIVVITSRISSPVRSCREAILLRAPLMSITRPS